MKTLTSQAQIEISAYDDETLHIEVFLVMPDGSRISATEVTEEQMPEDLTAAAVAEKILAPLYRNLPTRRIELCPA